MEIAILSAGFQAHQRRETFPRGRVRVGLVLVQTGELRLRQLNNLHSVVRNETATNGRVVFQVEQEQQSLQQESARRGPSLNVLELPASGISEHTEWRWARSTKASIPTRSYFEEIATTIFVPAILLLVLAALLSTVLCLDREKM